MGSAPVFAQDLSGELVILQWQGGTDAEMWGVTAAGAGRAVAVGRDGRVALIRF